MPDRLDRLREAVRHLEQELAALDAADAEERRLLEEALTEIEQALDRQDTAAVQDAEVTSRLQTAAESFEVSHPNLSLAVARILDALGRLGI